MPKRKPAKRHQARMLAFQVLYGLTYATIQSVEELKAAYAAYPANEDKPTRELDTDVPEGFAWELVEGVWSFTRDLDEKITRYSQNWRIERIGHIELTILRLAFFELFFRNDTPHKVVINEALELSTHFGEAAGKKFINGILDAAVKDLLKTEETA